MVLSPILLTKSVSARPVTWKANNRTRTPEDKRRKDRRRSNEYVLIVAFPFDTEGLTPKGVQFQGRTERSIPQKRGGLRVRFLILFQKLTLYFPCFDSCSCFSG